MIMASFGKRLTRFAAARTIPAVQSGFCVFLKEALGSIRGLRAQLQGKLNRE
jgi:hypothetical protein